jgi:hypothetical protein
VSDDARESCSARESYPSPAAFWSLSENESADSVHSGLGAFFTAQQDSFSGYNDFDVDDRPYSPIPDSAHPWDEIQPQPFGSTSVETPAGSQNDSTSRHCCDICGKRFASNTGLKRHVETIHNQGKDYWICTIKNCGKYDRPVFRKDNFRRHCKKKHPMVHLKKFGL